MLDHLLAILLLFVVPVRALWRSRSGWIASGTKITRYTTTIGMVTGLLALLATSWIMTGRSARALGLGAPTSTPSLVGLGIAVTILAALALSKSKKPTPSQLKEVEVVRRDIFPDSPREAVLFLVVSLAVGGGWEILYRGFLLFYLQSATGLGRAIVIASFAYGAAHRFKAFKQLAGSIVSALAFTIAYAATSNLWWLMLIHIGVMLFGAMASKTVDRVLEAS